MSLNWTKAFTASHAWLSVQWCMTKKNGILQSVPEFGRTSFTKAVNLYCVCRNTCAFAKSEDNFTYKMHFHIYYFVFASFVLAMHRSECWLSHTFKMDTVVHCGVVNVILHCVCGFSLVHYMSTYCIGHHLNYTVSIFYVFCTCTSMHLYTSMHIC